MAEVVLDDNPIALGYEWAATLNFEAGFLGVGEVVRGTLRYTNNDAVGFDIAFTRIGDTVDLLLTAVQTELLKEREYHVDLVLVQADTTEVPLNARLVIPAAKISTRPA